MKDRLINLVSLLLMRILRRLARLSDRAKARGLGVLERILARVTRDPMAIEPVRELRDIAENEPEGMALLNNLFLESRDSQFQSLLRGTLKHHVKKAPGKPTVQEAHKRRKSRDSLLHLGMAGDHFDLRMMGHACRTEPGCQGIPLRKEELLSGEESLSKVNSLEIADRELATEVFITRTLSRGVALSVHHAALSSGTLRSAWAVSRSSGTPFRTFYPLLHYPPLLKVKKFLEDDLIGEVCNIRIRATVGGKGGRQAPEIPDRDRCLDHPAFDHFFLLAFLGGGIERVTAYLNPMDPERGGQGLVNCKFSHPGRYGLLDCAFAPDLEIRSEYYPYDLELEIAGSDGIIWMNRGMAKRTQAPPIYVRVGQKAYSVGVECGLEEEWEAVYRNAVRDSLCLVRGEGGALMKEEEMVSALLLKEKVYEAAQKSEVVTL